MSSQRIHLRALEPPFQGQSWESDSMLRVGRLEELEIVLNDSSISRRHAEVAFTEQGWIVRDMGSTNGTFVNRVRVGRAERKLKQRDILQCGSVAMVVAVLEEVAPAGGEPAGPGILVEGAVKNSWDKALEVAASDAGQQTPINDRLLTLLRIGRDYCPSTSLDSLLQMILHDTMPALKAERGAIFLIDETTAQLIPRAVAPPGRELDQHAWLNEPLAQRALRRGESLLCRDTRGVSSPGASNGQYNSILLALLRSPRKRLGVLYLERNSNREPFNHDDLNLADALAASVSAGIESVGHFMEKERDLFIQTLTALAQAVELRDDYTGSHTQRVTDYAIMLAEELRISPAERHHLQIGTPLHDIGKIGISDAILRKTGHLTEEEFTYMKSHTWKGAAILEIIPHLAALVPIVRSHHERWDGSGYPDRLSGSDIPCLGRIVAVADAFDAMTTDRPYRPGLPLDKAFDEIRKKAGTQFDPEYADAFMRLRARIEELLHQQKLLIDTCRPLDQVAARAPEPEFSGSKGRRTVAIPKLSLAMIQSKLSSLSGPEQV